MEEAFPVLFRQPKRFLFKQANLKVSRIHSDQRRPLNRQLDISEQNGSSILTVRIEKEKLIYPAT